MRKRLLALASALALLTLLLTAPPASATVRQLSCNGGYDQYAFEYTLRDRSDHLFKEVTVLSFSHTLGDRGSTHVSTRWVVYFQDYHSGVWVTHNNVGTTNDVTHGPHSHSVGNWYLSGANAGRFRVFSDHNINFQSDIERYCNTSVIN